MDSVKNKVVLITGASSGIGAGTAQLFAKYGAKLVIGGRNEAKLKKTAKSCEEEGVKANDILIVMGDISKEEECNNIVDKAVEKFGQLDVVVNNAGAIILGNFEACTVKDLDLMYNGILRSVFVITKRAVPHLKKSKGCIVNVSTALTDTGSPAQIAYTMIKAAIDHFSKTLAQDLGQSGVRVNCIQPGVIDTGIMDAAGVDVSKEQAFMSGFHALKRVGKVDEVSQLIVFLCSGAASFITGAKIPVDGGLSGNSSF